MGPHFVGAIYSTAAVNGLILIVNFRSSTTDLKEVFSSPVTK